MNTLSSPSIDYAITDGNVVILAKYPKIRWVIRYGKYKYEDEFYTGWYGKSLIDNKVIPVTEADLDGCVVIDSSRYTNGRTPCEEPPLSRFGYFVPITAEDKAHYDAAFITVGTIQAMLELGKESIPDGKIVRVNDIDGEGTPGYYIWNLHTQEWDDFSFDAGDINFIPYTEEEIIAAFPDAIFN